MSLFHCLVCHCFIYPSAYKSSLYHHILNLEDSSLAKTIAVIQEENKFPGLIKACEDLLKIYKLDNVDPRDTSKFKWKKLVKKVVRDKFVTDLISKMHSYTKINIEDNCPENFQLKIYLKSMSLEKARTKFAIESQMLFHVKFNYTSEKTYEKSSWACDYCLDNGMSHIVECNQYENLRKNLNLHNGEDHVEYFASVVKLRNNLTCDT